MVSKNNFQNKIQQDTRRVPHYGLRKLSLGVASVLLSTTLYLGITANASTMTQNSVGREAPESSIAQPTNNQQGLAEQVLQPETTRGTQTSTTEKQSVGRIIPVDKETNNPIPGAEQPQYRIDPLDSTKAMPNEPVPEVPGYTPLEPVISPKDLTEDTKVPYTRIGNLSNADIQYIDVMSDNQLLDRSTTSGNVGSKIVFDQDPVSVINKFTTKGYVLLDNNYQDGDSFAEGGSHYVVKFVHRILKVDPSHPGKPGEPIDNNNPEGPKWPENSGPEQLTKTITRTINYVDENNKKLVSPAKDSVTFQSSGKIDVVTGAWSVPLKWDGEAVEFREVNTPDFPEYHVVAVTSEGDTNYDRVDQQTGNVSAAKVTPNDNDVTYTVHLALNVVKGKISYIDDDDHGRILKVDQLRGHIGDKIDYLSEPVIHAFTEQGYQVKSTNYQDGETKFVKNNSGSYEFEVHLKHSSNPVTREIDAGTATVHYVDAKTGQKLADDTTLTGKNITQHGTKDLVTGNVDWQPVHTGLDMRTVNAIDIKGYTPNVKKQVVTIVAKKHHDYTIKYTKDTPTVPDQTPNTPSDIPESNVPDKTPSNTPDVPSVSNDNPIPDTDTPSVTPEVPSETPETSANPITSDDTPATSSKTSVTTAEPATSESERLVPGKGNSVNKTVTQSVNVPSLTSQKSLPQTGNQSSKLSVVGLLTLGMLSLLGLKKRKHN